jgi:hypothetical protein
MTNNGYRDGLARKGYSQAVTIYLPIFLQDRLKEAKGNDRKEREMRDEM